MTCGNCEYTDGMCYTSNPPKRKCELTGEFHFYDHQCDCNIVKLLEEQRQKEVEELLDKPLIVKLNAVDAGSVSEYLCPIENTVSTHTCRIIPCMICGQDLEVDLFTAGPQICEDCKKAILFIRNKFKEELI